MLVASTIIIAIYALYVGGRLKQSEANIEVLRAALNRHLETGEDFRSDTAKLTTELADRGARILR